MTYRDATLLKINAAEAGSIPVRLAKQCVRHKIPVSAIADKLKVSRPTVYAWFTGKTTPIKSLEVRLASLLKMLEESTP